MSSLRSRSSNGSRWKPKSDKSSKKSLARSKKEFLKIPASSIDSNLVKEKIKKKYNKSHS